MFDPVLDKEHEKEFEAFLIRRALNSLNEQSSDDERESNQQNCTSNPPLKAVVIDITSDASDCEVLDGEEEGQDGTATMKQKESYLHQIGFFLKDKDGNELQPDFKPVDLSTITLQDLGVDEEDTYNGNDFGIIQDLEYQASALKTSNVDKRPNWAKASYPQNATLKLKESEWPREYTTFDWPAELEGKGFAWLTKDQHKRFEADFPFVLSYFWNVLHDYKQKHKPQTVTLARNRQISYNKFYSVVTQVATYLKNLWVFCMEFEGSCKGWLCFLSTKRMRAFHEYCRFRAGSPNTANNKAKYTQQVCQWLMANFPCLRPFGGELWIVSQQAGHFRRLMKQQQQVKQIDRPSFRRLLADGKAITAEQLKQVHATVFIKLNKSMEVWEDRIALLSPEETHRVCYNIQSWIQMLCHFKIGGQRQEVILHMTRNNFKYDPLLKCYVIRPDFKEKKLRKFVNALCFPPDCNPFFKFFLERVRPFLRQTDNDPLAIWLSFQSGLPQDPAALTRAVAKSCAKIIPGTHMTSLRWRHLLVTLAYLDEYLAGHANQQQFLQMLANVQNHDVGTLMQYYNDADVNNQATVLINQFNQDYLATDQSNVAAARARTLAGEQDSQDGADSADQVLDDLQSISEEEVIFSDRYRALSVSGKLFKSGHIYYQVQWETREPTWERLTCLKQFLDLIEQYEVKLISDISSLGHSGKKKRKKQQKDRKANKKPRNN